MWLLLRVVGRLPLEQVLLVVARYLVAKLSRWLFFFWIGHRILVSWIKSFLKISQFPTSSWGGNRRGIWYGRDRLLGFFWSGWYNGILGWVQPWYEHGVTSRRYQLTLYSRNVFCWSMLFKTVHSPWCVHLRRKRWRRQLSDLWRWNWDLYWCQHRYTALNSRVTI